MSSAEGPSYHERVARTMKASYSAGLLNTYEQILKRLREVFPHENQLRMYVRSQEQSISLIAGGKFTFVTSGPTPCMHCDRDVLVDGTGAPMCDKCGATLQEGQG